MWQLQHENRLLRQLLMASRTSCNDPEASLQDLSQPSEAQEHRMADRHAQTYAEQVRDEAAGFQEYLALVGQPHAWPRLAYEAPLRYQKMWDSFMHIKGQRNRCSAGLWGSASLQRASSRWISDTTSPALSLSRCAC